MCVVPPSRTKSRERVVPRDPAHSQGLMGEEEEKQRKKKKRKQQREELAPKKTNLGDSATIKRIMDDAVIQVRAGALGSSGQPMDVRRFLA